MNLKLIDSAIAAYEASLSDTDKQRLAFFRVLWDVQKKREDALGQVDYVVPSDAELKKVHQDEAPVFFEHPMPIDSELLVATLDELVSVAVGADVFEQAAADGLSAIDWATTVKATDAALAGRNPDEWLDQVAAELKKSDLDEAVVDLACHFARMAVRVQIEEVAAKVSKALVKAEATEPHSMWCPVCGSWPTMAHVGGKTSSSGRGKALVCPTCAGTWEYERVRCARCGTTNQAHLHYFNIEGDDAHRIATCDECGNYIRTLYSEDELLPCSYDVEDVVMARLDAIANDPQLAAAKAE